MIFGFVIKYKRSLGIENLKYRNLMGEISALGLVDQEIKEFLKKGNESDRYVIRPRAFDKDA